MKTVQSLLAVVGFVGAASAWGSGWSNETTVWTTVTTDVSLLLSNSSLFHASPRGVSTLETFPSNEGPVTLAPLHLHAPFVLGQG